MSHGRLPSKPPAAPITLQGSKAKIDVKEIKFDVRSPTYFHQECFPKKELIISNKFAKEEKFTMGMYRKQQVYIKRCSANTLHREYRKMQIFKPSLHFLSPLAFFAESPYDKTRQCLITPFMKKGDLLSRLNIKPELKGSQLLLIALDIACALEEMHAKNYVHGDLNTSNILLSDDDKSPAKLFDLENTGKANRIKSNRLSYNYAAPERIIYKDLPLTIAMDNYSFGMILLCMLNPDVFQTTFTLAEAQQVASIMGIGMHPRHAMIQTCLQVKEGTPYAQELSELILACTNYDPHKRPSAHQIKAKLQLILGAEKNPAPVFLKDNFLPTIIEETENLHDAAARTSPELRRRKIS